MLFFFFKLLFSYHLLVNMIWRNWKLFSAFHTNEKWTTELSQSNGMQLTFSVHKSEFYFFVVVVVYLPNNEKRSSSQIDLSRKENYSIEEKKKRLYTHLYSLVRQGRVNVRKTAWRNEKKVKKKTISRKEWSEREVNIRYEKFGAFW